MRKLLTVSLLIGIVLPLVYPVFAQPTPSPFDNIKESAVSYGKVNNGCLVSVVISGKIGYFCAYCSSDGSIGIARFNLVTGTGSSVGYFPSTGAFNKTIYTDRKVFSAEHITVEVATAIARTIYIEMLLAQTEKIARKARL